MWSANIPGKVAICVWRACNNLLPTRAQLSTKGYMGDLRCLLCSHPFETIGHIVCECPIAQEILTKPPFSLQLRTPHSFCFKEWMLEQASSLSSEAFAQLLMFVWSLWKNRNDKLWNDAGKTSPIIISITMAWYEEFLQANKSPTGLSRIHSQVSQHWSPPPNGCLLLNVDGSFLSSNNFGGVGGVLRSCTGDFIAGFS